MWIALTVQFIIIGILFWLLRRGLLESLQLLVAYQMLLKSLIPYLPEEQAQRVLSFCSMNDQQKAEMLERISQLVNSLQSLEKKDT